MAATPDPELEAAAVEELAQAVRLKWAELAKLVPYGDTYEGFGPAGGALEFERSYIWRAQPGGDSAGVGGRPAAALLAWRHGGVDALGGGGVDQGHGALVHVVAAEEALVRPRHHVDDRVADAENVKPYGRHACARPLPTTPPNIRAQ